jgi:hypothetical protein
VYGDEFGSKVKVLADGCHSPLGGAVSNILYALDVFTANNNLVLHMVVLLKFGFLNLKHNSNTPEH